MNKILVTTEHPSDGSLDRRGMPPKYYYPGDFLQALAQQRRCGVGMEGIDASLLGTEPI
jgi:hypothetical protein